MVMFELENTLDLVICIQYLVSNAQSLNDLEKQLFNFKQCLRRQEGFDVNFFLQLFLTTLPDYLFTKEIFSYVEMIIELQYEQLLTDSDDTIFEAESMFESVPTFINDLLKLSYGKKRSMVDKFVDYIVQESFKYNWDSKVSLENSENIDATLFSMFVKSCLFRINEDFSSFKITDEFIYSIKNSKFADLELLAWIKGCYIPLSKLDEIVGYKYSLLDYENILSIDEKVELIMAPIFKEAKNSDIINNVLIPYFQFLGIESWICFNCWMLNFGKKCVKDIEHSKIIENYEFLVNLLRNDRLLNLIDQLDSSIKSSFVSIVMSTIYLCPKAILQMFVFSKESLILLKSLNLTEESDGIKLKLCTELSIEELSAKISPTYKTIDSLLNIINIGEVLYSNELSIKDIVSLENASKEVQYSELIKFINNEVTYDSSFKKWSLFLNSIYSTLKKTSVFNKISIEELSEVILLRLLDENQFSVIKDIFYKEFNYITDESYQNLVTKHCWYLYMNANNCDQKLGSLKNCLDCLDLLDSESHDAQKLTSLIEVNKQLLDWKFYLKPGVPVTPKDICEVNNPMVIIRRILELNEKSYLYCGDLYYLLTLLIAGLDVEKNDSLYIFKNRSFNDKSNLLALKLKLICLEYSSAVNYEFSFGLAFELLSLAIEEKYNICDLYDLISENWFLFFQLSKNEYDDILEFSLLENKLKLLGNLILVTPTDFNSSVLEQWQMLNSQKEQMQLEDSVHQNDRSNVTNYSDITLGDVQARLQRSLKSSAEELLNTDSSEIGKNIIGWIVGAN